MAAGRTIRRLAVGLLLVVIAIAAAIHVAIMAGGMWLDSAPGQAFINGKIAAALQKSGYRLTASKIDVIGAGGLYLPDFSVADADGVFLSGRGLRLRINMPALATGTVPVDLYIKILDIVRLPKTAPKAPRSPGAPFLKPMVLPRSFIRTGRLKLQIAQLKFDPAIAGQTLVLAPSLGLQGSMTGNVVAFDLSGQSGADPAAPAWLPKTIVLHGRLDAQQALLTLEKFAVDAGAYKISARGQAALGDAGVNDLQVQAAVNDLENLTGQAGTATVSINLTGSAAAPEATVAGNLRLADYAAKGLGDIKLAARLANLRAAPAGSLSVTTRYGKRPLQLDDSFSTDGAAIANVITGSAPFFSLQGKIDFDRDSKLAAGTLSAQGNLADYDDLLAPGLAGKMTLSVKLMAAKAQGAALTAQIDGLQFKTFAARSMTLTASADDLKAEKPGGAILTMLGLSAPKISVARLVGSLRPAGNDIYDFKLAAQGQTMRPFALDGAARLAGRSVDGFSASAVALNFSTGHGSAAVTGSVTQDAADLALIIKRLPLGALPLGLPVNGTEILADGTGRLTGPLVAPVAQADLRFVPKNARQFTVHLNMTAARGAARAAIDGRGRGIRRLAGQTAVPLAFSLKPFAVHVSPSAALTAAFDADFDVAAVLSGFLPPAITLSGTAQAAMKGGGTVSRPDFQGTFSLSNGGFRQQNTGLTLRDIALRGALDRDAVKITTLRATDGRSGTMDASGTAGLGGGLPLDFKLNAAGIDLLKGSDIARGLLSADLTLKGRTGSYLLAGAVKAGPMNVNIPEQFDSNIVQLNIIDPRKRAEVPNMLNGFKIDVAIHAPERVFVRGWGLDAEFAGDLKAGGTLAAPLIDGTLSSRRGRFDQFGRSFSIDHANLRFQGAVPPSPYLDISASAPANDITATVALTGSVTAPALTLSSTPALPQDEVLSQLLFGKSLSSISPFQAIQIAQTLQQFSGKGGGGFDPLGILRRAAGLDDLTVGQSSAGATTLGAGKYLTNKVYVQVQAGADGKTSTANVQYELTPHLKLQSTAGATQTGGGVLWQWDY